MRFRPSTKETRDDESSHVSASEAIVARQPIFDREKQLYAYELLYRSPGHDTACVSDGEQATAAVLISSFLDIGLDRVVGHSSAFVNATHEFLVSRAAFALPPKQVVLEILEDVIVDDALLEAVEEYVQAGYRIALDDFVFDDALRSLLELVHFVKLDVMALDMCSIREHVELLSGYDVALLAEKVETALQYEALLELGFDYFQGYFFAKPSVLSAARPPTNEQAGLRLLARLTDPDAEIQEIAELVARDPALSYRLMRFVNSAFLSLSQPLSTIQKAVIHLGMTAVRRWVTMMVLAGVGGTPTELIRTVLVRARMAELLCNVIPRAASDIGFTVGLFSALDAFTGRPLEEILSELPLSGAIVAALIDGEGPEGEVLACVLAYEAGDWDRALGHGSGVGLDQLADWYLEAVAWSDETMAVTAAFT